MSKPGSPANLKFEVGKRYLTRGGDVARIISIYPAKEYAFLTGIIENTVPPFKTTFNPTGHHWNLDEPHPLDLIDEYEGNDG